MCFWMAWVCTDAPRQKASSERAQIPALLVQHPAQGLAHTQEVLTE